ncbi:2-amino-4-hydroxy-6-hydroxymethyldihydropteridine diphosphokinase [Octadecabacter sp. CECT 8868]|uniref:2-amino-4-hydroxy-6- hydroxymethyldihydropteridine diphosphokinase n=1 Tax=Octadecabacter algicola TaxID=2909342 RepID=UPI001F2B0180|nr:2-amino-4-hydroxy-6-hydroxymethyldihydropteridine diphosphokinase [Octadecabacter algicola]MCF2905748.1 2-amino-4-hydroxy-6-hydroxymethyldihydropteridine diphosphokinase [Octadecabacter algicola]
MNSEIVLIAMGSNATSPFGGPQATVLAAVDALRDQFGEVQVSNLYQTPAFPVGSGPDFVNAACALRSALSAEEILRRLHGIEAEFDRKRDKRWSARTLDLDLIACGNALLPNRAVFQSWFDLPLSLQMNKAPDELIVPHPRMQDRAFVLVPLADIAPNWVHPFLQKTTTDLLISLGPAASAEITPLN